MRILVPIDGSASSKHALTFLKHREDLLGNKPDIELLNVQYMVPEGIVSMLDLSAVEAYYETEGKKIFDELRPMIDDLGVEVTEKTIGGPIAKTIASEAERFKADLIIMGCRGRTPLAGFVFGSVSNSVLKLTEQPILLLREDIVSINKPMRVGVAVDGSDYGTAAARFILENAELFGENAKVSVINVVEDHAAMLTAGVAECTLPNMAYDFFEKSQDDEFKAAVMPVAKHFKAADINFDIVRREGVPYEEIARYAKDHLDLLVIGSHGYGNFKAAVLGSTAMHIAADCKKPLLIIRQHEA